MENKRYRYFALVMLMLMFAFSYVDRHVLAIVMQDIKIDLGLSDTQLGLMSGIAFSLFYAIIGLPLAHWADRGDRVKILSICGGFCCIMVALCGMANNFIQLILARIGVAVGEAGCVPPANSIIPEYFNRNERSRAVSIFLLGASLSTFIGYLFGGWINDFLGWRMAFILLSLPGGILSILAWVTLREPRRSIKQKKCFEKNGTKDKYQYSEFLATFGTLWKIPTFRQLLLAYTVTYFFNYGVVQWIPSFFLRYHNVGTTELGAWFAVINGICGAAGLYFGGEIACRFAANREALQLRVIGGLTAFAIAFCFFIFLLPNMHFALMFMGAYTFTAFASSGPTLAILQTFTPEHMRASAIAIILLIANIVGLGFGPLGVGVLSDVLTVVDKTESLRYALLLVSPGMLWMGLHFWLAARTVETDIVNAERPDREIEIAPVNDKLSLNTVSG